MNNRFARSTGSSAISVGLSGFLSIFLAGCQLPAVNLADGFEGAALDRHIWNPSTVLPERYWIDNSIAHAGRQSLAISVKAGDTSPREPGVQRQEMWLAEDHWLPRNDAAWYSFSFRMSGAFPTTGSVRWVINQWKEEQSGDSPYLAQRYDNGVFQVTVQDNDCRVTVAQAPGDPEGKGNIRPFVPTATRLIRPDNTIDPLLSDGPREACPTDITVERGQTEGVLPSPTDQWVHMAYLVRRGRQGTGLVEVWANGQFIARARGSIGNDRPTAPRAYFKFGNYRNTIPMDATMHLDAFKRSEGKP